MKRFFSEDHIEVYPKALSKEQCQFYIDKINNSETCSGFDVGNYRGLALKMSQETSLFNTLFQYKDRYIEKHTILKNIPLLWSVEDDFNVQKYSKGMAYDGEHAERGVEDYSTHRMLVWMFYLNDIKDGGGTCWPQQKFTSKPRQGSLIIWPADWTHSHYGIVANNEEKYIITGWFNYNKKGVN